MSDSVDRVFSHALNTVNKIRTGAEKPPASTRLKLYGLYKQSMEGDVEGIMSQPVGSDEETKHAREKWDAWKSCSGLSRTEAKRNYITTLIETMRVYASSSPDSRELVDELEFVWDQVKSNVPSSSSSSPVHHNTTGLGISTNLSGTHPLPNNSQAIKNDLEMRVMSPLSQSQGEDEEDDQNDDEEFVDAPDSQIAEPPPNPRQISSDPPFSSSSQHDHRPESPTSSPKKNRKPSQSASDVRWRRRVEAALVKMTAEVAAVREQLEASRLWSSHRPGGKFLGWIWSLASTVIKHVAVDVILLVLLLIWLRQKKDGRLEAAVRVMLGDTVAQVQKVGTGVQREMQKGVGKVGRALGAAQKKGGGPI